MKYRYVGPCNLFLFLVDTPFLTPLIKGEQGWCWGWGQGLDWQHLDQILMSLPHSAKTKMTEQFLPSPSSISS